MDEKFIFGTPAYNANKNGHLGPDTRSFLKPPTGREPSPQEFLSGSSLPKRRTNEVRGV